MDETGRTEFRGTSFRDRSCMLAESGMSTCQISAERFTFRNPEVVRKSGLADSGIFPATSSEKIGSTNMERKVRGSDSTNMESAGTDRIDLLSKQTDRAIAQTSATFVD